MSITPAPQEPVISARIAGHTAVLRIDGDAQEFSAVSPDALRETLMRRVLEVASQLDAAVRLSITDDNGTAELAVAPDGAVTRLDTTTVEDGATRPTQPPVSERRAMLPPPPPPTAVERQPAQAQVRVAPSSTGPAPPGVHRATGQRRSFITTGRAVQPATRGWRGAANKTGMRISPGKSEETRRADIAAVSRHWPGTRTVAVVNTKGSASKTPTVACLSAVFAIHGGSGVLAWDNNETEGTLRFRTEWAPHEASVLHLLPKVDQLIAPTAGVAEMAAYVHHQPADRYDVLWSDPTIDGTHVMGAADVQAIHRVASRYYRMVLMDSGNNARAENWRSMIDLSQAIVVPCTDVEDTAEVAARMLEALHERGDRSARLAENALVLVSQRTAKGKNVDRIIRDFDGLARAVVHIPYDPALETGLIRFDALRSGTQRAWLCAAAALSEAL